MSEETKTLEYVRELSILLQKDPSQRGRVMKILSGDSAAAVARLLSKRKQNMPYYKEHFAKELQCILDRMLQSGKAQEFAYSAFPRLSKHSLYLKVYQSFLWVVDNMDEDGKYIALYNSTEVRKTKTGVRICYLNLDSNPLNTAEELDDKPPLPEWRIKINLFVRDGEVGEKLVIEKLLLTNEQMEELAAEAANLLQEYGVMIKVSRERISLIKPRPEDLAALHGTA